jgi:hypothetical protein
MPISDDTKRRIKAFGEKVKEFMEYFDCDKATAWQMVTANSAAQALETTKRLEKRQEEIRQIELKRRQNVEIDNAMKR